MSRRFALIVNPVAGGGRALRAAQQAAWELERRDADLEIIETTDSDHARSSAAEAAGRGKVIVGVGGDGLVGLLAGVLKDSDSALAIVPSGRGNDFARVLGIPKEPRPAARLALEGDERLLDVGDVDGRTFVGIASLGFDSDANRIANEAKLIKGDLVYLYAALRALAAWEHANFEITIDGRSHQLRGYSVGVCNSQTYGGGMKVAPHAKLDDGRLEVLALRDIPKRSFLATMPKYFRGTPVSRDRMFSDGGSTIEIDADRPFTVYADGDPIGELPATISVVPRCLRVIVPDGRPR